MKFKRSGKSYIESVDGQYTVSKAVVGEKLRYTAWRRIPYKEPEHLGCYDSAVEAEARCRGHALSGETQHAGLESGR